MMEWLGENWILLGVFLFFGITLFLFFRSKTDGFGPYNSSTLILILALFISAIALFSDALSGSSVANIIFAIAGYAGGMMVAGKSTGSSAGSAEK